MPSEYKYNRHLMFDSPCWIRTARLWGQWSRLVKQVRSTEVSGSRSCRWQATSPYWSSSAPGLDLPRQLSLKVRESLRDLPFTAFCERTGMLQWHSHQGNYCPAPGTSDPENLSGLHQQLTSHSCLFPIRSLLWCCSSLASLWGLHWGSSCYLNHSEGKERWRKAAPHGWPALHRLMAAW